MFWNNILFFVIEKVAVKHICPFMTDYHSFKIIYTMLFFFFSFLELLCLYHKLGEDRPLFSTYRGERLGQWEDIKVAFMLNG